MIYNLIHLHLYISRDLLLHSRIRASKDKLKSYFVGFIYAFSHLHYFAAHLWLNITHIELIPLIIYLYIKLNKGILKSITISLCLILTILGYESLYFYLLALFLFFSLLFLVLKLRQYRETYPH